MKIEKFSKLIRAVTGRAFTIEARDGGDGVTLENEKVYFVKRTLPLTGRTFCFDWKTPKSVEKMLRSFITAFCSKFREPSPLAYADWTDMTPEQREHAHLHHVSNMFSREELLKQVEARFACPEMESALNQWGFYETEYGIGIFCFWETAYVRNAIAKMRAYLSGMNIAAREEYSDARWVYRFRIEASRDIHASLLHRFCH